MLDLNSLWLVLLCAELLPCGFGSANCFRDAFGFACVADSVGMIRSAGGDC